MSIDLIKSVFYEFLSYFVPQKQKYKITGKCNQCGKCCKEIRSLGMRNEKDLKFMQLIFPWYKYFYIKRIENNGDLVLSCTKSDASGKCTIYKFRPFLCRNYPQKYINFNAKMIDGCGYKTEVKDFKDYL